MHISNFPWPGAGPAPRGFSVIEVLIALGLAAMLGYALMSLTKTGAMGQKTLLAQDDARVLTDNMANLLLNANACEYTFGDGAPAPQGDRTFPQLMPPVSANPVNGAVMPYGGTAVMQIYDLNMSPQFVVGNVYGNRGIRLNGITIGGGIQQNGAYPKDPKTQQQLWTPGAGNPSTTGTAFVQVDWLQTGSAGNQGTGPQHLFRYFMVYVTNINSQRQITTCTAQLGGGGAGTGNAPFLAMWSASPYPAPGATEQSTTLGSSAIYQDSGGNIGIGTTSPGTQLDVAGGIKPGNGTTGNSCAGNSEGSFGYDSMAHAPVFCSNTGKWMAIGGPAPGTPGSPCTSTNYPGNKGVVMYADPVGGGARFCCGFVNGNNINTGFNFGVQCDPY